MKPFTITKTEKLPDSVLLIEGEISNEAILAERKHALDKFQEMISIDGFRKGHIPEKVLVEKASELAITEESGAIALERHYDAMIKEVGVSTIGQPRVSITKIAPGQAMSFKIETTTVPEVVLPDYKTLAKKIMVHEEKVEVSDQDLADAIKEILTSLAHHKYHQEKGETTDHNHKFKDEDLPELTDELVKTLGQFDNVQDFKEKLKNNLLAEKDVKTREKRRLAAIEEIIKETKVETPALLVESELNKMLGQFKDNIVSMGMTYEDYLKQVKKTEEELRDEWKEEAKKRATIQLILNKIAAVENITANLDEVKKETQHLLTYYKEADPVRMEIYVENMMVNDKVWKFLEEQK